MKAHIGVEVYLHPYLAMALNRSGYLAKKKRRNLACSGNQTTILWLPSPYRYYFTDYASSVHSTTSSFLYIILEVLAKASDSNLGQLTGCPFRGLPQYIQITLYI
jgi:hypothetical protein